MVRSGNHHRIDALAAFVQHFAEIPVELRVGMLLALFRAIIQVGIAQRVDILAIDAVDIAGALAPGADGGDVEFAVQVLAPQQGRHAESRHGGGSSGGFQEVATIPAPGTIRGFFHSLRANNQTRTAKEKNGIRTIFFAENRLIAVPGCNSPDLEPSGRNKVTKTFPLAILLGPVVICFDIETAARDFCSIFHIHYENKQPIFHGGPGPLTDGLCPPRRTHSG